jgi:hypothetical protein
MIPSQKSRVMLLVANVMQQIKKLIVVLLGLRAQKALFTPSNYCTNDFILIRFYKNFIFARNNTDRHKKRTHYDFFNKSS